MRLTDKEKQAARILARKDLYFFSRYMFLTRKGYAWQQSPHHKIICDKLMQVYNGEIKNLIINLPPRYSKCVTSDIMVFTNNGYKKAADVNIGDVVLSHIDGKIVEQKVIGKESFVKDTVTVTTNTGRQLNVSYDHPVLTQRGWVNAAELTSEHYLIRVKSEIDSGIDIDDDVLTFITMMLFEGGTSNKDGKNIRFTSDDNECLRVFENACANLGIKIKHYSYGRYDYNLMGGKNGIAANLLREYGLLGCLAKEKRLPSQFFNMSLKNRYKFISLMIATDGYVHFENSQLAVCLASEGLIDDISLLLDTCGVTAVKYHKPNDFAGAYELKITSYETAQITRKLNCLHKQARIEESIKLKTPNQSPLFGYPHDVTKGLTGKCRRAIPKIDFKNGRGIVSYKKFARMVNEVDPTLAEKWVKPDFMYDRVKSVVKGDKKTVHHIEVNGNCYDNKNYICNGIVVHNTELAVVNFIAWALGNHPDCEFIHSSYSATLAVNNSSQIRDLLQNEEYQAIFDTRLKDDSKSKDHWKTTSGGVMYATGAGGTITGFGAGKLRDGFGGCFPFDAKVWTEKGLMCIGDIVTKKMQVNVWAYDYNGNIVLKPITAWHKNPPNSIIRVGFSDGTTVECTPCHKLWTNNRGWVRADSLTKNDILPCVNSRIKTFNDIFVKAKSFGSRSQSKTIFTTSSISSIIQSNIALLFAKLGSKVSVSSSLFSGFATTGYRFPRSATPYTLNDANINIVASSKFSSWYARSVIYFNNLSVSKLGTRVDFSFAKSFVNFAIDNIGSPCVVTQIFKPIIKRVAVTVANISTNWSLPNKSKHDETVNKYGFNLSVFGKVYTQVSMCIGGRFKQLAFKRSGFLNTTIKNSSIFASNIANIANTIKPFIRGNRQPTFIEYVRHDNQTFCLTVESYHNFIINSGLVVKNCIILDDPHKADEARSDTMRSNVINWFTETIKSRRNDPSKTPIIIIMQRLHENDLSGYLLAGNDDDEWQHLKLPAIQDDGTALWEQKHSIDKLRQMQIASPYMFAGQYMQEPAPLDGGVFKPSNIEIIDAVPAGNIKWVRGWDLGATVGGDPTAAPKLGKLPDGRLVIADMVHGDVSSDDRDRMMKNTASQDGKGVLISIPQDPGQAGKTQVQYLVKLLQGYKVHTSTETGDKVTRAEPFASQVNVGNVLMVKGDWNQGVIDEMRMFPNGARDDRIDGLSRAYSQLIDSIFSYDNV